MAHPTSPLTDRIGRHFRIHHEWYWAPVLYALVVSVLYWPVFGGGQGFGWDTIESYWPDLIFFSREVAAGDWPLWNPYDRGGYPFFADPQSSIFYPVQWFFAIIGALLGEVPWWLAQLKMLFHHALAGVLMHLFLRSRKLERPPAIIGACTWIASAPWLIHKASNVLLPMAWVPLVWLAIDRFVARPSLRSALLLAGALYLPGSAGSPPGFFYTLLLVGSYGLYRAASTILNRRRRQTLEGYPKRLLSLGLFATIVTIFMLLITVIPGLDLSDMTERGQRDLAYSLSFPLPVKETLIGLWVPAAGKVDAYIGFLSILLATIALTNPPNRAKSSHLDSMPFFLAPMAVFFLVLAFGGQTPLLGWLVEHAPGFDLFRAANRYKLLYAVLMAPLAAYGASAIMRNPPKISRENIRVAGTVLFTVALTLVVALKLTATDSKGPSPIESIWIAILAAALVLAATYFPKRIAGVILIAATGLTIYDADHFWHWRGKILEARVDHLEDRDQLERLTGAGRELRIYDEFQLEQRAGSRLGVRDFRGYPSGDPLDFSRYRKVLSRISDEPELLAAYNVGYILSGSHHRNRTSKNYLKRRPSSRRPEMFAAAGRVDVTRSPAPWLAWYNTTLTIDEKRALDAIAVQAKRDPDERIAIIEPDSAALLGKHRDSLESRKTLLSGSGEVVTFSPDRIVATVKTPSTALVVLNEVQYPGWEVYVDDEPAKSLTANYLLRAVVVEAGAHLIEWRFSPPRYPWLLLCWLLCLAAILGAVAGPRLRRFKKRKRAITVR